MSVPISSYTFVTSGGQRRFVHRWQFENNEVIECNKCGSACKETDAYSKHWPQPKTLDDNELNAGMGTTATTTTTTEAEATATSSTGPSTKSSSRMTTLMDHKQVIVSKNIESFMLCDTKAVSDTQQFLLDAGIKAVPDLLSAAYAMCGHVRSLGVMVRFYVKIKDEMFMLQTTELAIKHHYDIRESVDMMFTMLLEKLRMFVMCREGDQQEYTVKRLHVKVRRQHSPHLTLPLHYARKQAALETATHKPTAGKLPDLSAITSWFKRHFLTPKLPAAVIGPPPFPCNLYCFQECQNSLELYVVPYHLSGRPSEIMSTRSFVLLCDVFGHFVELQEIFNIKRFLHHSPENRIVSCSRCQMNFVEPSKLALHKLWNCGTGFEILKMDLDFIEIYENCLLLEKCDNWSLFGIIE